MNRRIICYYEFYIKVPTVVMTSVFLYWNGIVRVTDLILLEPSDTVITSLKKGTNPASPFNSKDYGYPAFKMIVKASLFTPSDK
jgi:hypothetical protein